MNLVLVVFLFSLYPCLSANAEEVQTGQLASLRDLDEHNVHKLYWIQKKENHEWMLKLENSLIRSPMYESLKELATGYPTIRSCELLFNVSSQGSITDLKWSTNSSPELLTAAIVDLVQSVQPSNDVPKYFPKSQRVVLTFDLQPNLKLRASYLPISD